MDDGGPRRDDLRHLGLALRSRDQAGHRHLGTIHSLYIYLANGAAIALGASALLADPRLAVVGWAGIVMGAVFAVGYRLLPAYFAPPFIPTVYPAVLGIAVLVAL